MSTGNRFPVPKTPEERAEYVATHFEQCPQQIAPYVKQLRCDFRALKAGETIMECRTWTEFCKKVLKRTDRAVRYIIAGGNPRSKRKSSKPSESFDPGDHWRGMPDFDQNDQTAFQTIKVHIASRDDREDLAQLFGQEITDRTRSIWYPEAKIGRTADKAYCDAATEVETCG